MNVAMSTAAATQAWTWVILFAVTFVLALVLFFKHGTRHKTPAAPPVSWALREVRENLPTLQYPYLWETFVDSRTGDELMHIRLLKNEEILAETIQPHYGPGPRQGSEWAQREFNRRFGGITDHGVQL